MHPRFHSLKVRAVERQTPDSVALSFDLPKTADGAFAFRPGQYVTLRTTIDGHEVRRPYSICSVPGEDHIRVGVKRVEAGAFSPFANERLRAGDAIDVMTPEGRFGIEIGGRHDYLMLAAGSGITPILSIVRAVLEGESESTVTLVYGNRSVGSIMFREELEDLKDRFLERFTLVHVLSREEQDVQILNGRIDRERIGLLAGRGLIKPQDCDAVFVCGPGDMIEEAIAGLRALGIGEDAIRCERFTPADGQTPRMPPSAAARAVAEHGGAHIVTILDGTRREFDIARPDDTVLSAAQAAGIELPYSCAGGMCCTCRCRIVEGETEMAVNYSLEPWEIAAGFTLACQSRPKTSRVVLDFDAV